MDSPKPKNTFYDFVINHLFDTFGLFDEYLWVMTSRDFLSYTEPIEIKEGIVVSELTCTIVEIEEIDSIGFTILTVRIKLEDGDNSLTIQTNLNLTEGRVVRLKDIDSHVSFRGIDLSNCTLFQVHGISVSKGICIGPVLLNES